MDAFITGDLPPVDVLDGTDASNQLQFTARPPSGFGPLLLLLGVIPYLIWGSTSRSVSRVDELERLVILRAEGAITSEEFEAAKRQVLGTTTRDAAM